MPLESLTKQGYDSFILTANFVNNMRATDTLILGNTVVTAIDKDSADATATVLEQSDKAVSGTRLQIRVKAGTQALSPFKVTFKTGLTTLGDQWEKDVRVRIKEL
jgi:hypothetical protein